MSGQVRMCSVRFADGQFGSELRNGSEIEAQAFPTGGLQPLCVRGGVFLEVCVI